MDSRLKHITHIFLDADDTLWENDSYFRKAEAEFVELMSPYVDEYFAAKTLARHQEENIKVFGYGSKTYLIAMCDAALEICPEEFGAGMYSEIRAIILRLALHRLELMPEVEDTLKALAEKYTLIIATKGESSEQMRKWHICGLQDLVSAIEVMENKSAADYRNLAVKAGIAPENFFMVGNAVRSDVLPVIEMGGWAVYVPHKDFSWQHEFAKMPDSEKVFEIENISQLKDLLL